MNQQELASQIVARARTAGYDVSIEEVTRAFLPALQGTVGAAIKKGERVTLLGFGTFERRDRKARTARNPRTNAPVKVKATKIPAFRAGPALKTYVAGGRSTTSSRTPAWLGMTSTPRTTSSRSSSRSTITGGHSSRSGRTTTSSSSSSSSSSSRRAGQSSSAGRKRDQPGRGQVGKMAPGPVRARSSSQPRGRSRG
jgi:DNA-binding protein HU-beta